MSCVQILIETIKQDMLCNSSLSLHRPLGVGEEHHGPLPESYMVSESKATNVPHVTEKIFVFLQGHNYVM